MGEECVGGRKSGGNKGGEVGVRQVVAEGNHRGRRCGSSRETRSEVNKIVVRKVQRCNREGLCGTVSCENEI